MIKVAFDRLRNMGFIARPGVREQHDQATAAIGQRAMELVRKGYTVNGCVFFTQEAVSQRTPDGAYPICFGPVPVPTPEGLMGASYEECGRKIMEVLLKSGVYAEWDGCPDHAIIVKEN